MTPETINAFFTGALLLVGALTTYTASRSRKLGIDRRYVRKLEGRYLAARAFIFKLKRVLIDHGINVPAQPDELDEEDDDPIEPAGGGRRAGA